MFGRLAMGFANVRAGTRVLMLVLVQAGVYYHAAWMSTYTSQLAEMVPPTTFYSQLEKYRKNAESTDVFVLNVSDLLPVLMAAELIMKYLWSRAELEQAPSVAVAQTRALTAWAAREYTDGDAGLAGEVTGLLERYYGPSLIPSLCTRFTRARIEWRR